MTIQAKIKKNTYFDSVSLMSLSTRANLIAGVKQAMIGMGTDMNKEVIRNVGMGSKEIDDAGTGDLMITIETDNSDAVDTIFDEIDLLFTIKEKKPQKGETVYKSINQASTEIEEAKLVVISVNGAFAAREAQIALDKDLHVMLFSDNVSIEEELSLKKKAHEKGLLMMGPDCGTAIINNIGLCFANKVRKGSIGIVAASGTGAQEMSVRIHEFGYGISQLIGTGGRDLSEAIGGIMMLDGLAALEKDDETKVIVLVSKPPAKSVEVNVLEAVKNSKKPVVVYFLGGDEETITKSGGYYAKRSKEAAIKAVVLAGANEEELDTHPLNIPLVEEVRAKLSDEQKYIRGLFCGGTLCDEAMFAAMEKLDNVYSNIHPNPEFKLVDNNKSQAHTFIDFGSDEFTSGKPHPMIDPSTRIDRFLKEAADPEVAVIVLDFVLGYGSHEDPVGVMLPAIEAAKKQAEEAGRHLEILGYVLGTELDVQNIQKQTQKLMDVGVTISSSSQNTGLLAREFVLKGDSQ
ncbi:MAG: acyl-CoA synthetase FdrA [Carnobacterium sp.]